MCLAVPGQVVSIETSAVDMPTGRVSFGGIIKEVCFAYVPDAKVGEYVLVHVGFALQKIDEEEAAEVFKFLEEMGELEEIGSGRPAS